MWKGGEEGYTVKSMHCLKIIADFFTQGVSRMNLFSVFSKVVHRGHSCTSLRGNVEIYTVPDSDFFLLNNCFVILRGLFRDFFNFKDFM